MARRTSRGKSRSKGSGGRKRTVTKRHVQRSKRTTIIKTRGRRSKPTIFYEEYYEEEW